MNTNKHADYKNQSDRATHGYTSSKDEFHLGTFVLWRFPLFPKLKGVGFPFEHSTTSHFIALSLSPHICKMGDAHHEGALGDVHQSTRKARLSTGPDCSRGQARTSSPLFLGQVHI